jgi:S-adenosylmethionine:tRNA-ribosyltransferase-isomerase (queuine synthetase)
MRRFLEHFVLMGAGRRFTIGHSETYSERAKPEQSGDAKPREPVELLLEKAGQMPLPPYIASKRGTDESDQDDYQTMFARESGAVAAPTAALHFTDGLIAALDERGVKREMLTLHVGAGTFLPVKSDDTTQHKMQIADVRRKRRCA